MSLVQLLLDISPGSPRRQEVWGQLYAQLQELASEDFIVQSTGKSLNIPNQDRDDVVNAVALKILEKSPLPVVTRSEGESKRYLKAMLRNRWIDDQRRRNRHEQLALEEQAGSASLASTPPSSDAALSLTDNRKLLERVYQELYSRRAPRFRKELAHTWAQVRGLAFEDATMQELLRNDEGVTASTSLSERKAAQQRIHQNHSRLRKSLLLTVDVMNQEGLLSPDDAMLARQLIANLNRCQSDSVAGVAQGKST